MKKLNKYFEYKDGKLFWKTPTNKSIKVGDLCNHRNPDGYIRVGINGKQIMAHRIIWEMFNGAIPDGLQIDHINEVKDDNRIENLQLVTNKQNQQRRSNSRGYQKTKNNRTRPYMAYKGTNYKLYNLGYYGTPCGAYMANRMFFINR
jgi:hypothetical protein